MPGRLLRSLPGARARTSAYAGCTAMISTPGATRPKVPVPSLRARSNDCVSPTGPFALMTLGPVATGHVRPMRWIRRPRRLSSSRLEMSSPPEDAPFRLLAASVQAQIDGECLTRAEAVETVRPIAAELDINESAGELIILRPGLARDMQPHGRQRRWTDLGDSARCLSAHRAIAATGESRTTFSSALLGRPQIKVTQQAGGPASRQDCQSQHRR